MRSTRCTPAHTTSAPADPWRLTAVMRKDEAAADELYSAGRDLTEAKCWWQAARRPGSIPRKYGGISARARRGRIEAEARARNRPASTAAVFIFALGSGFGRAVAEIEPALSTGTETAAPIQAASTARRCPERFEQLLVPLIAPAPFPTHGIDHLLIRRTRAPDASRRSIRYPSGLANMQSGTTTAPFAPASMPRHWRAADALIATIIPGGTRLGQCPS